MNNFDRSLSNEECYSLIYLSHIDFSVENKIPNLLTE